MLLSLYIYTYHLNVYIYIYIYIYIYTHTHSLPVKSIWPPLEIFISHPKSVIFNDTN